ncbi:signal peptidase II [Arcanobacterium canis]|uniref:Lipoprotein signal peptidase n=1 Tax=Arcanobacterium canis TaxID=999183 RepID=A0ABY8FW92_9ACTO|nr:signal peptidase II [Arcanobacterium canis]WFM82795.1 signal peptidase II [Arcanobacterium canis]
MKLRNFLAAMFVGVILVVIDFATKQWALSALSDGHTVSLIGDIIGLKLIFNSGAAFSFLNGHTWIFTLLATGAVLALPVVVWKNKPMSIKLTVAAIWAGALGNLIDRLFREPGFPQGHVVDFIKYGNLFIGNFADIVLVVAVVILIVMLGREDARQGGEK